MPPKKSSRRPLSFGKIIGLLLIFTIFSPYLIPLILFSGVGFGAYYLITRKSALKKKAAGMRLDHLKELIAQCDRQLKLLDSYLTNKSYTEYTLLARKVLPQLATIKEEAKSLQEQMEPDIYRRVTTRAHNEEDKITLQLEAWNLPVDTTSVSDQETDILTLAPEIATTYHNIQRDHNDILEKLKTAENAAELQAIHDINMKRFKDILDGYLQIKESPKNYYNAEERLNQAKLALEKFDKDLDETLRKLNESQLSDFEISLRMMSEKTSSDIY